jgi:hypothetical protein
MLRRSSTGLEGGVTTAQRLSPNEATGLASADPPDLAQNMHDGSSIETRESG